VKRMMSGRKKELVLSPQKIFIVPDNSPDIHHYSNSDLSLKEKVDLVTWQDMLID